jgi:hypothetical protein
MSTDKTDDHNGCPRVSEAEASVDEGLRELLQHL